MNILFVNILQEKIELCRAPARDRLEVMVGDFKHFARPFFRLDCTGKQQEAERGDDQDTLHLLSLQGIHNNQTLGRFPGCGTRPT